MNGKHLPFNNFIICLLKSSSALFFIFFISALFLLLICDNKKINEYGVDMCKYRSNGKVEWWNICAAIVIGMTSMMIATHSNYKDGNPTTLYDQ